MADGNN